MKNYKYIITATNEKGIKVEVSKANSKVNAKFIFKKAVQENPKFSNFKIES